jgi:mycofactocin precursor
MEQTLEITDIEEIETDEAIEEELLVEEISIDGMCGVY